MHIYFLEYDHLLCEERTGDGPVKKELVCPEYFDHVAMLKISITFNAFTIALAIKMVIKVICNQQKLQNLIHSLLSSG